MTFRVLESREISQYLTAADADALCRPAPSPDTPSPFALFRSVRRAQLDNDGDCLVGLGFALGIEATAAILAFGAWVLLRAMR